MILYDFSIGKTNSALLPYTQFLFRSVSDFAPLYAHALGFEPPQYATGNFIILNYWKSRILIHVRNYIDSISISIFNYSLTRHQFIYAVIFH
jgi:hypothetical protein